MCLLAAATAAVDELRKWTARYGEMAEAHDNILAEQESERTLSEAVEPWQRYWRSWSSDSWQCILSPTTRAAEGCLKDSSINCSSFSI